MYTVNIIMSCNYMPLFIRIMFYLYLITRSHTGSSRIEPKLDTLRKRNYFGLFIIRVISD